VVNGARRRAAAEPRRSGFTLTINQLTKMGSVKDGGHANYEANLEENARKRRDSRDFCAKTVQKGLKVVDLEQNMLAHASR
jgi:hypothetical protein